MAAVVEFTDMENLTDALAMPFTLENALSQNGSRIKWMIMILLCWFGT